MQSKIPVLKLKKVTWIVQKNHPYADYNDVVSIVISLTDNNELKQHPFEWATSDLVEFVNDVLKDV